MHLNYCHQDEDFACLKFFLYPTNNTILQWSQLVWRCCCCFWYVSCVLYGDDLLSVKHLTMTIMQINFPMGTKKNYLSMNQTFGPAHPSDGLRSGGATPWTSHLVLLNTPEQWMSQMLFCIVCNKVLVGRKSYIYVHFIFPCRILSRTSHSFHLCSTVHSGAITFPRFDQGPVPWSQVCWLASKVSV